MQRGESNRMLIRSTHISLQPTILTLLLIHLVMMILGDFFSYHWQPLMNISLKENGGVS